MSKTFLNPVIAGFHPDPSVCRVGTDYWLVASSFGFFPGLPVFHSRDLVHWDLVGHGLSRSSQLNFLGRECSRGIFAPTLRYHEGTFYLITTDVGGIGNFLLTSEDPAGEWSDPVRIREGDGFPWFDPSLLFAADGKVYYTRRDGMTIVQAEINVITGELTTPLRVIHVAFTSDDIEGPHLYQIEDWYYLLCAEGGTGWGHAASIGRSRSPWGPFEHHPDNPILTHRHLVNHPIRATGHGDLLEAHDGSWWMVFLATRHAYENGFAFHHLGRETFLAPVTWEDEWPIVNEGRRIEFLTRAPDFVDFSRLPAPKPLRDAFASKDLDPSWTFLRSDPGREAVRVIPGKGLRLRGLPGTLDDTGPLAFVGQRLDQPRFVITATLAYLPETDSEEAGLTLFLSETFHAEVLLTRSEGSPVIEVRQRAATLRGRLARQVIPRGEVHRLQIRGSWEGFNFSHGAPAGPLRELAHLDRRLFCSEVATGWTGCFAGLYATGNGQPATGIATCTAFEHARLPYCLR